MIKNLKISMKENSRQFDLSGGVFASFETEDGLQELRLEDIEEYWDYANEDDIESFTVYVDGDKVIADFSVASGQGGVATVWDSDGKLIHISNGEYGIASAIYDDYVYTLRGIEYYGNPLEYTMTRIPLGTMDAWEEATEVPGFDYKDRSAFAAFTRGDTVRLAITDKEFIISCDGKKSAVPRKIN